MKRVLLGLAVAFLVLSLVGGYGFGWTWTGFAGNGSLWDWLNLFLLPVTLAFVPMAFSLSTRALLAILGAVTLPLVVMAIGGYELGWAWTGFPGNTLWDWMHLVLVPIALPFAAHSVGERQKAQREQAGRAAERPEKPEAEVPRPKLAPQPR